MERKRETDEERKYKAPVHACLSKDPPVSLAACLPAYSLASRSSYKKLVCVKRLLFNILLSSHSFSIYFSIPRHHHDQLFKEKLASAILLLFMLYKPLAVLFILQIILSACL